MMTLFGILIGIVASVAVIGAMRSVASKVARIEIAKYHRMFHNRLAMLDPKGELLTSLEFDELQVDIDKMYNTYCATCSAFGNCASCNSNPAKPPFKNYKPK